MRNNFEHMDERIDRWWLTSKQHNYVDRLVGLRDPNESTDLTDIFRVFDPSTTNVGFWGEEFSIQALVDEVTGMLPTLAAELEKPQRA